MNSYGHSFGSQDENEDEMENKLISVSSQLELLKQKAKSDGVEKPIPDVLEAKSDDEENQESKMEKAHEAVEMRNRSLERECKRLADELESEKRIGAALWASHSKELEKAKQENENLSNIIVNRDEYIEELKTQLLTTEETGKKERNELYNRTVAYEKREKELYLRIKELEKETSTKHHLEASVNELKRGKEELMKELDLVKKELKQAQDVQTTRSNDVKQLSDMNNELKRELAAGICERCLEQGTVVSNQSLAEDKNSMNDYLSYLNRLFEIGLDDLSKLIIRENRECEFCHKPLVDVIEMDRSDCYCCSLFIQMIQHKEKIKRLEENNRKERHDYYVAAEYRRKQSTRIRDCIIFILVLVISFLMPELF